MIDTRRLYAAAAVEQAMLRGSHAVMVCDLARALAVLTPDRCPQPVTVRRVAPPRQLDVRFSGEVLRLGMTALRPLAPDASAEEFTNALIAAVPVEEFTFAEVATARDWRLVQPRVNSVVRHQLTYTPPQGHHPRSR